MSDDAQTQAAQLVNRWLQALLTTEHNDAHVTIYNLNSEVQLAISELGAGNGSIALDIMNSVVAQLPSGY